MKKLYHLILVSSLFVSINTFAQIITTVAGIGSTGYTGDGGAATSAKIEEAYAVTTDHSGNFYTSGWNANGHVRIVNSSGIIKTFTGNGTAGFSGDGGAATAASLNEPLGICSDAAGNIYICDLDNARIRKVNTSGTISTFAGTGTAGYSGDGGPATAAAIYPWGITSDGTNIYFSDYTDHRIRKIDASGTISCFAGTGTSGSSGNGGPATAATLIYPEFMACDASGNLYISDWGTQNVRKINASTGIINAFAGTGTSSFGGDGGPATAATFANPSGISVDEFGNVYIGDFYNNRVRKVYTSGIISTIAGSSISGFSGDGGPATAAGIIHAYGLSVDGAQNVFVCDYGSYRVRKITQHNSQPYFTGGHSVSITVCDSTTDSLNSILAVYDSDFYQPETWSLVTSPLHGTAVCIDTAVAAGTTLAAHSMYYAPTTGYLGADSFRVRIFDGQASDTTTVHVIIGAVPGPVTGIMNVCSGLTTVLSDTSTGCTWSSGSAGVAGVGTTGIVTGISAGVATISYTAAVSGCSATAIVTINPLPPAFYGTLHVCKGSTTSVTDSITGGAWISGATTIATIGSSSGSVAGISAGTSVITYTSTAGCTRTGTVTVNASPSLIAGPAMVCVGSTIVLSDTVIGGTWSVAGATAIGSTGILTGTSAGTAVVTYTLAGGCLVTKLISVNPVPGGISGSAYVCVGATTTMYESGSGVWTSSSPSVAAIGSSSGIASGISAGTTIISYTNSSGCNATMPFTINAAPPAITGITNACIGTVTLLADSLSGGTWTSSDYSVAYIYGSSGSMTGLTTGVATVTYTASSGCSTTTLVTINAAPTGITGLFGLCAGSTTTLSDGVSGGTWISSDITKATIGSSTGSVTGIAAGSVTITYSTGPGCTVTQPITIYAAPATITGTTNVCVSGTTTLADATTGGRWSCTGGATINSATGLVTGITAGTALVSYTTGGACAATITITVNSLPSAIGGTLHACPGTSGTLTDGGGGTWSITPGSVAGIGSTSGILSGVISGTATVTYALPTGCSVNTGITIDPLPAAISGPTIVCAGQSITLTDGGTGTWSRSNTNATVGSASGIVTGVASGTDIITYTLTTTGCYITQTITVNTTAGTISGTGTVCIGSATTLTDGGGGTWSVTPISTATIGTATGIVTGIAAGTATVTYSLGTGCTTSTTITVNALPATIGGTGAICMGSTATLTDGSAGTWSTVSTTATVGSTGIVTGTAAGTAIITYTAATTGCMRTATETVNALPGAISGPTALCRGASITLSDGTGTWVSSNTAKATIGATTGIVTGVDTGTTTITFTNAAGCKATTMVTVSNTPTAIIGANSVCMGDSTTLTDAIGGGFWTCGPDVLIGSLSGVVTGVSSGTTIITYSLGSGCTVTKFITVNISPNAITGSMGVCTGNTTVLADATTGGVWSSTPTTIATITTGGTVSGIAAGTAIIDYTIAASGCKTTTTVTVNNTPGPITGVLHVCIDGTTTLGNSAGGGTWTAAHTIIELGSADGVVTGLATGTIPVTYSLGTGCTVYATVTVSTPPAVIVGTLNACVGSSVLLTDATSGGTWTSALSTTATAGSTGIITGVSAGIVNISYTPVSGCAAVAAFTVNALPDAITGTATVCEGLTTTLSDATTGGTWSSASIGATVDGTGIVTAISPGTAIIIYTLPVGCSKTTNVLVNAAPVAIGGITAMCIGSSTVLTDASGGGSWSSAGGTGIVIVGSSSGAISGIGLGTATVSYTIGGCPAVTTVTVNSLPNAITGNNTICAGSIDTLDDITTGGVWTSSAPATASIIGPGYLAGVVSGTVTVTYSMGVGCNVSKAVTIKALPAAVTGPTEVCYGYTITLHDVTTGGTWSSGSAGIASISTSGIVTGSSGGTAVISYTSSLTGCVAVYPIAVIQVPAITGTNNLCASGDTMTVSDALPGGSWTSTSVTVSTSGGVISFVAGAATITYTMPSGCYVTAALTVNPVPAPILGNDRLCVGLTTTLTDAATGGVWSSTPVTTATATGGTITGVTTGTAVVAYTFPVTGCAQQVMVTVEALPSAIVGTANVCAGVITTLSDTTTGGGWTSGSTGIAIVGATSGTVSGLSAGIATITYIMGAACMVTKAVTVSALPSAYTVTGGGSYCASGTGVHVGLSDGAAGTSYQLYDGSTSAGAAITGAGTAIDFGLLTAAGVYTVTATNGAGCERDMTGSATISINPSVTPTISIAATSGIVLCAGVTADLISAETNGGTPGYTWEVNGTAITGATTGSYNYTPANGDVITLIMNSTAPCASPATVTSNAVTMTINPELIPTVIVTAVPGTVILAGENEVFTAVVTGGGATPTYQWMKDGTPIPGATNSTYSSTNLTTGDTITCDVTSSGPCGGNSGSSNHVGIKLFNNVGVGTVNSAEGIQVYPNPAAGGLTIEYAKGMELVMYDVVGREVLRTSITDNKQVTDISRLGSGVYVVSISDTVTGNKTTVKVVKE